MNTASAIEWVTSKRGGAGLRPDPQQFQIHPLPGDLVERAERLVEQQDVGRQHQRTRDRDALLHAARQRVRQRVFKARAGRRARSDRRWCAPSAWRFCGRPRRAASSIFWRHRTPRQQRRRTGTRSPASARGAPPRGVSPPSVMRAGKRLHHVGDQTQQRGLAATARTDDRGELSRRDVHVDLVERDHRFATAVKDHGDLIDLDVPRHGPAPLSIRISGRPVPHRCSSSRRGPAPSCRS